MERELITSRASGAENKDLITELGSKERPLVERWISECLPIFGIRNQLVEDINNGSIRREGETVIFQNGMKAPSFLLPIMELWAEKGPMVLCSYAHPEHFEFYKFMGQLNLVQFIDRMRACGVDIPMGRVTENWYETVVLDRSVTEPLNFGGAFPKDKLKADILGLAGCRMGSELLNCQKQLEIMERNDIGQISQIVVNRLVSELDQALRESDPNLTRRERYLIREVAIKNLIAQRLSGVISMADSVVAELRSGQNVTVNDFLIEFEERFAGLILGRVSNFRSGKKIGDLTGIEGKLSSKNREYIDLVLSTIGLLVQAKGVDLLKNLVNGTGEGLFIGFFKGQDVILTVDKEDNSFALMNSRTGEIEQKLSDAEVLGFVRKNNFALLAKPETLVLVAGGMTFHMGSEHGNRARALSALGLDGEEFREFSDYLARLRIGQDLEQGNRLFLLNGTKPIPAILAFVLFGKEFLRVKMLEETGANFKPENITDQELRWLTARLLVKSMGELKKEDLLYPPVTHAGYAWS